MSLKPSQPLLAKPPIVLSYSETQLAELPAVLPHSELQKHSVQNSSIAQKKEECCAAECWNKYKYCAGETACVLGASFGAGFGIASCYGVAGIEAVKTAAIVGPILSFFYSTCCCYKAPHRVCATAPEGWECCEPSTIRDDDESVYWEW